MGNDTGTPSVQHAQLCITSYKDHVLDLVLPAEVTRDQVGDLAKSSILRPASCVEMRA